MAIFSNQNNVLKPVNEVKFDLEKDIQQLTENNLPALFGLTFVSGLSNNEFSVRAQEQEFYIDTLAYDEQLKSFVIIEYKKDRNFSVIDQGFSYLSAMLHNKAEFILELNKRLGKNFGKDDIDWEQSRLIFISPDFTNYQKNAINFKDLPFALYEVHAYDHGLIQYEPIKAFRTSASIQTFTKDKIVKDVSKEVKVFNVEDHFQGNKAALKPVYDVLRDELLSLDPRLKENPRAPYIGFALKDGGVDTVLYVHVKADKLRANFSRVHPAEVNDYLNKLRYRENSMSHDHTHVSELDITTEKDAKYTALLAGESIKKFFK